MADSGQDGGAAVGPWMPVRAGAAKRESEKKMLRGSRWWPVIAAVLVFAAPASGLPPLSVELYEGAEERPVAAGKASGLRLRHIFFPLGQRGAKGQPLVPSSFGGGLVIPARRTADADERERGRASRSA